MGQQMELLEHESQLLIAQVRQGIVVEVLNGLPVEAIGPSAGAIQAAQDVHGRAFA